LNIVESISRPARFQAGVVSKIKITDARPRNRQAQTKSLQAAEKGNGLPFRK
jgi:hypothetical protein